MNIAFYWGNIPDPLLGGIDRVTVVLAEELKKRGYHVYCIYSGGKERPLLPCFIDKFKYENPRSQYQTLEKFLVQKNIRVVINQRFEDRGIIKNLSLAAKSNEIKLFTVFHSAPGFQLLCQKSIRGLLKWCYIKFSLKKVLSQHFNEVVQYSDNLVLLSESFKDQFINAYDIRHEYSKKCVAIANPCTYQITPPNLLIKDKIVLVVSRLEESPKRISFILNIWNSIHELFPEWKLIIVGEGTSRQMYEDFCKTHNLTSVCFMGRQDPKRFYEKASLFLMTSSYEGWPLTLPEAMIHGVIPIVMDSFSALHDIIDNTKNGFIIHNNDIKSYIAQLKQLMANADNLDEIRQNAIEKASTFSVESIVEKWECLFKNT